MIYPWRKKLHKSNKNQAQNNYICAENTQKSPLPIFWVTAGIKYNHYLFLYLLVLA